MQADGVTTGSLVPVGFPLLIGAGTLTVIISMRSMYSVYNILIAVLINILIMYFVLRSTNYIERKVGETGLHAITKFFGVVSLALAIKIFRANFFQ
jgi:multiple antibiotic resistance protein